MKARVRISNSQASGRRTGWTKHVTSVDTTKNNGYAFEGEFLNDGLHELPVGAVLVSKDPAGSVKHARHEGSVGVVQEDGSIAWQPCCDNWREDFLLLRDAVQAELSNADPRADLREAWETVRDAINSKDECPHWETCDEKNLARAELRQASAMRKLQDIAAYLGILR
jgi:hypothetical protein